MVNPVTVPNFSQYNFAIGDTTEVVTKQNGVNAALQQFGNSLNASIDQFNDDVAFVDTARQEVDADNIVHAPGSGLPNEAGTAYSRDMGTAGNQIRTNQQNDGRYYTQAQVDSLLGNYYTQSQVDSLLASRLPAGLITMWSGAVNAVPAGWALCNGSNGTPDLRNRFIVGAGSTYSVGSTGGANSVTLTTAQIPAHNHSVTVNSGGSHNHSASTGSAGSHSHSGSTNSTGNHRHSWIYRTGSGSATGYSSQPTTSGNGQSNSTQSLWTNNTGMQSTGSHSHSLSINSNGAHTHTVSVASGGAHTHSASSANTGGGGSHENRPPYYALAYIMKL